MKNFLFFFAFVLLSGSLLSQSELIQPEFPGGESELYAFLGKNLVYPKKSQKNKIEGRVFISFIVEKDGSITTIRIEERLDKQCNKEARRVVKLMPNWSPGRKDGKIVRVRFILPLRFTL